MISVTALPSTPPGSGTHGFTKGALCILLLSIVACSVPPARVTPPALPSSSGPVTQTGIASWYGPGFHGRPTASGEIYDQHQLTAAHQTLPLGTKIMVTNLDNGSAIEVTVNDRGPFAKGRILDLSYAAAQSLGMIRPGTIPVRIEVVDGGPYKIHAIRDSLDYTLQIGSFARIENAQTLRDRLVKTYSEVTIVPLEVKEMTYYRVQIGKFATRAAAEAQARQVAREGFPVIILEK